MRLTGAAAAGAEAGAVPPAAGAASAKRNDSVTGPAGGEGRDARAPAARTTASPAAAKTIRVR